MDALEGEWVRGATWYLEKAVEVVASSADPLSAAEKLRQVRPGMASLDFLYLVVKEAAARGVEAAEAARRVSTYVEEAKRRLDAVIAEVECPRRAVTISFSRAVTRLLERCRGSTERLYLAESRPGRELSEAYATYSRLVETAPIPDSAVGAYDYDMAVAGLDGRYLDYAVNKVGTLPLFAAAKTLGAKTVAVFESYKVVPLPAPRPPVVEVELAGRRVEVPLFDKMPPGLVDLAVTDLGALKEVQPRAVFSSVVEKIFIWKTPGLSCCVERSPEAPCIDLDEEVYIYSVERRGLWLVAVAYVRSQTEKEVCYLAVLKLRPVTRYFVGRCECPDYKYRGGPCKHIVKAKVALR